MPSDLNQRMEENEVTYCFISPTHELQRMEEPKYQNQISERIPIITSSTLTATTQDLLQCSGREVEQRSRLITFNWQTAFQCREKTVPENRTTSLNLKTCSSSCRRMVQAAVIILLLATSAFADPLAESASSAPGYELEYTRPSSPRERTVLERLERGTITAAPAPRRTSPQKRQLGEFPATSRYQRLLSKSGFFLEVKKRGKVKGTRKKNPFGIMELRSISPGVVAIINVKTGRYLAFDRKGRVVGLKTHTPACNFHEKMVGNNYFIFFHEKSIATSRRTIRRTYYLGFDRRGRPKRGHKLQRNNSAAHFQKLNAKASELKRKKKKKKTPRTPKGRRNRGGSGRRVKSRRTRLRNA
ncbi:uncharacterized protein LOC108949469 [Ciona intestinalis]